MKAQDMEKPFMEVFLLRGRGGPEPVAQKRVAYWYTLQAGERPTALDVLKRAKEDLFHDLSFRYGCRNQRCGLCTLEINGRAALACRSEVKDGDTLGPLRALPLIRDFVVDRSGIEEKLRGLGRGPARGGGGPSSSPSASFVSLTRCIACYACLNGCPLQGESTGVRPSNSLLPEQADRLKTDHHPRGDPHTFLRLRRIMEDREGPPGLAEDALSWAVKLGLETCASCGKCRCLMGINLMDEVIHPLLRAAAIV